MGLAISPILDLQPIPGDPKDNGVAAMLNDRMFCFVIQHGRHATVFLDLQGLVANQEDSCINYWLYHAI